VNTRPPPTRNRTRTRNRNRIPRAMRITSRLVVNLHARLHDIFSSLQAVCTAKSGEADEVGKPPTNISSAADSVARPSAPGLDTMSCRDAELRQLPLSAKPFRPRPGVARFAQWQVACSELYEVLLDIAHYDRGCDAVRHPNHIP